MADPTPTIQGAGTLSDVPLVASLPRWAASSAGGIAALAGAYYAILSLSHVSPTLSMFTRVLSIGAPAILIIVFALLRAEESRLARELRTVRTGTAMLRSLVVQRAQLPMLARWSTTKLGTAAVLLAEGDRGGAAEALRTSSAIMRLGRLEKLRAFVEADLERTQGNAAGLERCVERLRGAELTGNREADLYRLHVLVKAVLAQGDAETGDALARELGASIDDDVRVYGTWLRVWFELDEAGEVNETNETNETSDATPAAEAAQAAEATEGDEPWPPLTEGDLRIATLAARAHGAEQLVSKLTARLSAIARSESRG
jgi:hypothetical protein